MMTPGSADLTSRVHSTIDTIIGHLEKSKEEHQRLISDLKNQSAHYDQGTKKILDNHLTLIDYHLRHFLSSSQRKFEHLKEYDPRHICRHITCYWCTASTWNAQLKEDVKFFMNLFQLKDQDQDNPLYQTLLGIKGFFNNKANLEVGVKVATLYGIVS